MGGDGARKRWSDVRGAIAGVAAASLVVLGCTGDGDDPVATPQEVDADVDADDDAATDAESSAAATGSSGDTPERDGGDEAGSDDADRAEGDGMAEPSIDGGPGDHGAVRATLEGIGCPQIRAVLREQGLRDDLAAHELAVSAGGESLITGCNFEDGGARIVVEFHLAEAGRHSILWGHWTPSGPTHREAAAIDGIADEAYGTVVTGLDGVGGGPRLAARQGMVELFIGVLGSGASDVPPWGLEQLSAAAADLLRTFPTGPGPQVPPAPDLPSAIPVPEGLTADDFVYFDPAAEDLGEALDALALPPWFSAESSGEQELRSYCQQLAAAGLRPAAIDGLSDTIECHGGDGRWYVFVQDTGLGGDWGIWVVTDLDATRLPFVLAPT